MITGASLTGVTVRLKSLATGAELSAVLDDETWNDAAVVSEPSYERHQAVLKLRGGERGRGHAADLDDAAGLSRHQKVTPGGVVRIGEVQIAGGDDRDAAL